MTDDITYRLGDWECSLADDESEMVLAAISEIDRLRAKLEGARVALQAFRDAWRYSVHMSGPEFSGFNHSALMRAVPLTVAALAYFGETETPDGS